MYAKEKPLYKLDPLTTGAYVNKCINEKLFPICKFFWSDKDINKFIGYVCNKIGINKNRPEDRFKQLSMWNAVQNTIKKDKW